MRLTLKGFLAANPFRVQSPILDSSPELSLRSNSGLKLANAFGVITNRITKRYCSDTSSTLNVVGNVTSFVPRNLHRITFIQLWLKREVDRVDDLLARTGAPHDVREPRIVDLQTVTNNVSPLWIGSAVVYDCVR